MGLSIFYKGRLSLNFDKDTSLSKMIDEVKDIAEIHQWEYHIFETDFDPALSEIDSINSNDKNIYGITYTPPGCEPICITFLSNGKMCYPYYWHNSKDSNEDENHSNVIFSKTQYAGVEAHKIIIDLFRYLSEKYFKEFELNDESRYWETGDEEILQKSFKRYNDMMDQFAEGLENTPEKENESTEDFVMRVAKKFKFK